MLCSGVTTEAPLTISPCRVNDCLAMTCEFSVPGKVKFAMENFVNDMLRALPNDMEGTASPSGSP
jgi:hypothetical protein